MAGEGWREGRGTHSQNLDLRDGMEDGAEVRGHHPREQRRAAAGSGGSVPDSSPGGEGVKVITTRVSVSSKLYQFLAFSINKGLQKLPPD